MAKENVAQKRKLINYRFYSLPPSSAYRALLKATKKKKKSKKITESTVDNNNKSGTTYRLQLKRN